MTGRWTFLFGSQEKLPFERPLRTTSEYHPVTLTGSPPQKQVVGDPDLTTSDPAPEILE